MFTYSSTTLPNHRPAPIAHRYTSIVCSKKGCGEGGSATRGGGGVTCALQEGKIHFNI